MSAVDTRKKLRNAAIVIALMTILLAILSLSGCGKKEFKDGTYTGQSGKDDKGAYGVVTITIKDNVVTECTFVTYKSDGTVKDKTYGSGGSEEMYEKAQLAVDAMSKYAADMKGKIDPDDVEVVTGATIAYGQFNEAVNDALEKAKK
jgi:Major membrane immunogen, membrane-anchored lipoprotein